MSQVAPKTHEDTAMFTALTFPASPIEQALATHGRRLDSFSSALQRAVRQPELDAFTERLGDFAERQRAIMTRVAEQVTESWARKAERIEASRRRIG